MREPLAPTAERIANSCCRAVPRARSRMETLPQPMASSSATAPKSKNLVLFGSRVYVSARPRTLILNCFGEDFWGLPVELLVKGPEFALGGGHADAGLQLDLRTVPMELIGCHFHRNEDVSTSPCEAHRHHAEEPCRSYG